VDPGAELAAELESPDAPDVCWFPEEAASVDPEAVG